MLIEQYLPNISDPVYSVHQSFMWFLWLNWRISTFYPVTAPNGSKCWPIVTSSIQEPVASNCDVTMTDCFRVVAMDAFLAQWWGQLITAQWATENISCFNFFAEVIFYFYFVTPVFQHGASLVTYNSTCKDNAVWCDNLKSWMIQPIKESLCFYVCICQQSFVVGIFLVCWV